MTDPAITFDEIRQIPEHFTALDRSSFTALKANITEALKRRDIHAESYIDLLSHCAWIQQEDIPALTRPVVAIYAALHGIKDDEKKDINSYVKRLTNGEGSLNNICEMLNSDFRVYELDIQEASNNFTTKNTPPALEEDDAARACAYGMMAIEQGANAVYLGTVGQGSDISGQCILGSLGYNIPEDALLDETIFKKAQDITQKKSITDPLLLLQHFGGYDQCAVLGAMIAARLSNVPILIDSWSALACAMILHHLTPQNGSEHIFFVDALPQPLNTQIAQMPLHKAVDYPSGFAGPCHLITIKMLAAVLVAQTAIPKKVISFDQNR